MRRLLALLALAACSEPASSGEPPAPVESARPPIAGRRTAPPIPPRVLHAEVRDHGVLPSGDLLVVLTDGSVHTLDPQSGATTPWPLQWRPADAGWSVTFGGDRVSALEISPDGRWIAMAIPFARKAKPSEGWRDMIAIAVARSDTGATRCNHLSRFDDLEFTGDSTRIVGRLPLACEPDPRGAPTEIMVDGAWPRALWIDLQDGSRRVLPGHLDADAWFRDPLGDAVVLSSYDPPAVRFFSSSTGADLGGALLPAPLHRLHAWVQPDAVHLSHDDPSGMPPALGGAALAAIAFADGRVVPVDPNLTIYTRLPNGEVVFNEGGPTDKLSGPEEHGTFHQGTLDSQLGRITHSIPRDDLAGRTAPRIHGPRGPVRYTWTPALGGLLIHRTPDGPLEWAGL